MSLLQKPAQVFHKLVIHDESGQNIADIAELAQRIDE